MQLRRSVGWFVLDELMHCVTEKPNKGAVIEANVNKGRRLHFQPEPETQSSRMRQLNALCCTLPF